MKSLKYIAIGLLSCVVLSNAMAFSKPDLEADVKKALDKCYTEVKGSKDIIDKSAGVLVFPEVTKGGLGLAIESGNGALVENGKVVGFYKTQSASIGATAGVGTKSVVVALRTPEELNKFKESAGWEIGADSSVAMLSSGGASGSVDTNTVKDSVVGMVFGESGLIVDASLKGSKVSKLE